MKTKMLLALALSLLVVKAHAQTPPPVTPPADFTTWLSQQQAHAGVGYGLKGKTKYAVTWWDLAQYGQAGMNVGNPSTAHDYVDLGPALSVANSQNPRYGAALPMHVGNLWNDVKLPSKVASHINLTAIPDVVIAPLFLAPDNLPLNKWRWDSDFQITLAYGFGGS